MFTLGMAVMLLAAAACSASTKVAKPSLLPGPNPDVIPAVITPAYVNAVFKVLNHIDGDVSRSLVANGTLTPSDMQLLRAIYGDPLYADEVRIAAETEDQDVGNVKHPLGDRVTTVVALIDASASCVFVATRSDYSQVLIHPTASAASEFWRLSPKKRAFDPGHLNPTDWMLTFNATYTTPTSIPDQCAST